MLLAVVGAKLSEGLNFADELARAVVVVGLPYPNLASPELRERMKFVTKLSLAEGVARTGVMGNAATELYENLCMKAVNQSIGVWDHLLSITSCQTHGIRSCDTPQE